MLRSLMIFFLVFYGTIATGVALACGGDVVYPEVVETPTVEFRL